MGLDRIRSLSVDRRRAFVTANEGHLNNAWGRGG